jgi:hypothetical protein
MAIASNTSAPHLADHEHGSFGADAITSGRSGDFIACGRFNLPNDIDESKIRRI